MIQTEIPTSLKGKIETFMESVLASPNAYHDTTREENEQPVFNGEDPFDPSVPGVSDNFIHNKDRTVAEYKGVSLETNAMSNLIPLVYPPADIQIEMVEWAEQYFQMNFRSVSGRFYYPENGGFMGWHTNSDMPGKRIYVAYASEENGSYFKYFDEESQQTVVDWDEKGLNVRAFDINRDPEQLYWHCVYADKPRISYGFLLV